MSADNYNIDDILSEAKRLREQADSENRKIESQEKFGRMVLDSDLENALNLAEEIKESGAIKKIDTNRRDNRYDGFEADESFKVEIKLDEKEKVAVAKKFSTNVESVLVQKAKIKSEQQNTQKPLPTPKDFAPRRGQNDVALPAYGQKTNEAKLDKKIEKEIGKLNRQGRAGSEVDKKRDLFSFKPEQRKKPFTVGKFGQQRLNFNTPNNPNEDEYSSAADQSRANAGPINVVSDDNNGFDFDAISKKIEEIHMVETTVKNTSPFAKANNDVDEKERIKNRYNRLIFNSTGAMPDGSAPPSSFTGTAGLNNAAGEPKIKKSIFSTFATGTGRELKIEDIRRIDFSNVDGVGDSGLYDDEDERNYADVLPEGQSVRFEEFDRKSNRRDVARDISNNKKGVFIRTAIAAVITFVLFYLSYSTKNVKVPLPPAIFPTGKELKNFLITNITLILILLGVCYNTVISGVVGLFKMRANSDTLVTFAMLGSVFQGVYTVINIDAYDPKTMTLFFPIAALTLLFNYAGKLSMVGRIQRNFKLTAGKTERRGAGAVDSPGYCKEILPNISESKPTIAYSAKADFFTDFLSLSFSTKYDVGVNRGIAPVCILGAIIVAIATRLFSGSGFTAVSALVGVLCMCSTLSSTFIEHIPLAKMSNKLIPMGAMVSGNKAIETFCDTEAIVLKDSDVFPKGHVYLNGIKAFPNARIDEAILDAASVLCALQGSLGYVFLDVIGGNEKLLKKVDNVVYENHMGLSGWVDGRRVLIGNRMLMQNHGVKLPNDSYERENPRDTPGNPVYLSNSGEVSARFLAEYVIDETLAYQLDLFAAKEKKLIIYTNDANIDAELIWRLYSYPADLITILPSELQEPMRELMEEKEDMPAEIVYTGKPASFIAAILATINARSSILTGTIIQFIQIILGYGIVAMMAFMGTIETFAISKMVGFHLFWFAITYIAQQIRKP